MVANSARCCVAEAPRPAMPMRTGAALERSQRLRVASAAATRPVASEDCKKVRRVNCIISALRLRRHRRSEHSLGSAAILQQYVRSRLERSRPCLLQETSAPRVRQRWRSEEHTSELQSHLNLVCRLLLEKKK